MMADTIYRVRINYNIDSGDAERGVARMTSGFSSLRSTILGAAAAFGVSAFAHKIFELGSNAEDARIAIAGMMQAGGAAGLTRSAEDFAKAMGMSGDIIKVMRKDARELPGEFEDLMNVFRMGLGGGLGAGKTVMEIEKLSARMMAVGATLQLPSEQVGREFAMMMEGRAGAHNALFMRLKNQIKMSALEFNALTQPAKWKVIDNALKGYDPAIKAFGDTWSAVSSTTTDYLKTLTRVGTAPVFEMVKRHLNDWNEWFVRNQAHIEQIATLWGTKLANAIEKSFGVARGVFGFIVDNQDSLVRVAEAYAMIRGAQMFGAMPGLGNAGKIAGNMAGGAGLGVALAALTGGLQTNGDKLNAAMMGVEGAFMTLPGPIGLVAGGLTLLHGGLQTIASWIDENHKAEIAKADITDRLMGAYKAFELNEQRGSTFSFDKRALTLMKEYGLVKGAGMHATIDNARFAAYVGGLTSVDMEGAAAARRMFDSALKYQRDNTEFGPFDAGPKDPFAALLNKQTSAHNVVNITNHNTINQTIENANDPDRVLLKTREALEDIFRHQTVSPHNRFATAR